MINKNKSLKKQICRSNISKKKYVNKLIGGSNHSKNKNLYSKRIPIEQSRKKNTSSNKYVKQNYTNVCNTSLVSHGYDSQRPSLVSRGYDSQHPSLVSHGYDSQHSRCIPPIMSLSPRSCVIKSRSVSPTRPISPTRTVSEGSCIHQPMLVTPIISVSHRSCIHQPMLNTSRMSVSHRSCIHGTKPISHRSCVFGSPPISSQQNVFLSNSIPLSNRKSSFPLNDRNVSISSEISKNPIELNVNEMELNVNEIQLNVNEIQLNEHKLMSGIDQLNNRNGDIIRLSFDNVVNLGELRKKSYKKNFNLNNADNYKLLLCYNDKKIQKKKKELKEMLKKNLTKVIQLLSIYHNDNIMKGYVFHCISDERGGGGILVSKDMNDYLLTVAHLFENELYTGNNIKLGIIICSNTQRLILINNQLCIISLIDQNSYNTELDLALCKIVSILLNNKWTNYDRESHRQYLNFLPINNSARVSKGEELILRSLNIIKNILKKSPFENKTCSINLCELHTKNNNSNLILSELVDVPFENKKAHTPISITKNNSINSVTLQSRYNFGTIISIYKKDFIGKKNEYSLKACNECIKQPYSSMLMDEGGSYCRIYSKKNNHEINKSNTYINLTKEELREKNNRGEFWNEKSGYSMIYDMDTIGGNSGYPLFLADNPNELLGIHSSRLPISDAENTEDDTEVGAGIDINTIIDFINYYELL